MSRLSGLYVIVNENDEMLGIAAGALRAGVRLLQYRAKQGIHPERLRRLRAMTRANGALLILNDNVSAVFEFDCDGVHLGPGDDGFTHIAGVRMQLGDRIIGISCGKPEEIPASGIDGCDYLGVGPVFVTGSKSDAGDPIGIDGLTRMRQVTQLPLCAIGGITAQNIRAVRASGVAMAAVISGVSAQRDPEQAARELLLEWRAR